MIAFGLTALVAALALTFPVAAVLFLIGYILQAVYSSAPLTAVLGEVGWSASHEFLLVAVPMFILLGEILVRAGIAGRMYDSLALWMSWLPGGMMHANIGTCAIFAATSGSSIATAATVSTVALPLVQKYRYNESLFLGTLAAGGTLGILIPPSINLIIYAVLTDTSIPKLYLAGLIPGFVLAGLFSLFVMFVCIAKPHLDGQKIATPTWGERFSSLRHLLPPLSLFVVVVGSIYAGLATPTEAAGLGVVMASILAYANGQLNIEMLCNAFRHAMRTTSMVMIIVIAAYFLNFVMSAIGTNVAFTNFVMNLGLSKYEMLLAIVIFYLILGCFMDTLAMMIATIPITAPVMFKLGFDPIWYGIVIIILVEIALITPPFGMNLFVVQSRRGRGPIGDVIRGALPFVVIMLLFILILTVFPALALWLPSLFDPLV